MRCSKLTGTQGGDMYTVHMIMISGGILAVAVWLLFTVAEHAYLDGEIAKLEGER